MSELASKLAPTRRLRVAIHAVDSLRRTALGKVVAEAGHLVVGVGDTADVVLADSDGPPGETRPVVTLGGADHDLPGVLSRHASANQIDAAIRAVAAGLIVRWPGAGEAGFAALRETDGHALLTLNYPRATENTDFTYRPLAADAGSVTARAGGATRTVNQARGTTFDVPAAPGDTVSVAPGAFTDRWGNSNGEGASFQGA